MNQDKPCILKQTVEAIQICIPDSWTDAEIVTYCDAMSLGMSYEFGYKSLHWTLCHDGHPLLNGLPERCSCDSKENYNHVVLELKECLH